MHYIAGKTILVETDGQAEYTNVAISFHNNIQEAETAITGLIESLSSDDNIQEFFVGTKIFNSETDAEDYNIISLGCYPKI